MNNKEVNHKAHFFGVLITGGLWLPVYLIIIFLSKIKIFPMMAENQGLQNEILKKQLNAIDSEVERSSSVDETNSGAFQTAEGTSSSLKSNSIGNVNGWLTKNDGGIKRSLAILFSVIAFVFLISFIQSQPSADLPKGITGFHVCKSAMAAVMGRPVRIMKASSSRDVVYVNYVRPSDGSKWKNKCRIESNNRIMWASNNKGDMKRWRNHEMDSKVYYSINDNSYDITITQVHYDKSRTVKTYKILTIDSHFDKNNIPSLKKASEIKNAITLDGIRLKKNSFYCKSIESQIAQEEYLSFYDTPYAVDGCQYMEYEDSIEIISNNKKRARVLRVSNNSKYWVSSNRLILE